MKKLPHLEWHRFELIPEIEDSKSYVWKGEQPAKNITGVLVACKDGTVMLDWGFDTDSLSFHDVDNSDVLFWAYPFWK